MNNEFRQSEIRLAAASRIEAHVREGTLVQVKYYDHDAQGREIVCLLSAACPGIGEPTDCPANLMPQWLAYMIPSLFIGVRVEQANDYALRFADALRRGGMDDAVLRQVMAETVKYALEVAAKVQPHPAPAYWPKVKRYCEGALYFLMEKPRQIDLEAAEDAAWVALEVRKSEFDPVWKAANVLWECTGNALHACLASNPEDAACSSLDAIDFYGIDSHIISRHASYEHIFDALINAMLSDNSYRQL